MPYVPTQPVLELVTSCLYPTSIYPPRDPTPEPMHVKREVVYGKQTQSDDENRNGIRPDSEEVISGLTEDSKGVTDPAEDVDMGSSNGVKEEEEQDVIPPPDAKSQPPRNPYKQEEYPVVDMFRAEYCRRHGWAKEDPLGVAVDLGSRGGVLGIIDTMRKKMQDRIGRPREWDELPVSLA
jgi:hypothetical protein